MAGTNYNYDDEDAGGTPPRMHKVDIFAGLRPSTAALKFGGSPGK